MNSLCIIPSENEERTISRKPNFISKGFSIFKSRMITRIEEIPE